MAYMRLLGLAGLAITLGNSAPAQVIDLSEALRKAEVRAQVITSNDAARAYANREYLRLHPEQATNALTSHQLQLLDIQHDRLSRSNYLSQPHSAADLQEFTNTMRFFLTNAAAQSSYFFHLHGMTESEYVKKLASAQPSVRKPWPEPSKRKEIFEHSASLLRSAVDRNVVEAACNKLNDSTKAAALREIANEAQAELNMFADSLASPDLKSFVRLGHEAELSTRAGNLKFRFWPETASTDSVISDLEKRTPDGRHVFMWARFGENGKLLEYESSVPDEKGVFHTDRQVLFNNDGTLRSFWKRHSL